VATHDSEGCRLPLTHWTRAELERELDAQLKRRFVLTVARRPFLDMNNEQITEQIKYRVGVRVCSLDLLCGMATDIRLEVVESGPI
jgi:hypothetical protein